MRKKLIVLALLLSGCGGENSPQTLNSDAFYRRRTIEPNSAGGGVRTRVGPVDEAGTVEAINRKTGDGDSVDGISDTVTDASTKTTRVPPARPLVWAPPVNSTTTPTTLPTGQYMIVGTVLADVDGAPIFANQVLDAIDNALAARARELNDPVRKGKPFTPEEIKNNETAFRSFAIDQIKKEVEAEVRNELVYRAAQRSLNDNDRKLVDGLTTKWRQDEIIAAGGSVELARRRAKADGREFEQNIDDKHRWYMTQVYYEKKVIPLIVVTADMMRAYYDKNKAALFTDKTAARFRIVKIKVSEVGDSTRAKTRAREWQEKLAGGEDFAKFAREFNTDSNLRLHDGLPMEGMIDRGAFAIKPVEDAAWALEQGQVSNVIEVGDYLYIVKLEQKTVGRTKPFDSEEVQDQISRTMRSEQFRVLREREETKLKQNAILRTDEGSIRLALGMAMQRYQQWVGQ